MTESQTGGNGKAGEAGKVRATEEGARTSDGATEGKAAESDPLGLAHAIVTAAIKCRDNTSETEIPFVVGIRRIEIPTAQSLWCAIGEIASCGVRMEPVPDHRDLERAVLLFFREATKGRSDGATKG